MIGQVSLNALLTWPNLISLSRVFLIAPTLFGLSENLPVVTLSCFCAIIASDFFDGIVARKINAPSRYGTLVDHGSDAIVVVTLCAFFAHLAMCTWTLPVIIAVAFAHYAFDSQTRLKSSADLGPDFDQGHYPRPSSLGRTNGIAYFIFAGFCIALHHGQYYLSSQMIELGSFALAAIAWILATTTAWSIWQRWRLF